MARVVMAYTFADVDSGEEIIAKVAGQGLDPGDKAPYKAMTGALKYALLQSFLLATGDDPEDERLDARSATPSSDRPINAEEVRELEKRIDETGTDLERVLAYYKVDSRNLLPARGRSAESQTREAKRPGDSSCPGLNGCIRTLPNGTAGDCRGLVPATLR
jgi:ERF superfamily